MNSSEEGAASFSDFMSDLEGQVMDLMKATNKAPTDAWQSWVAFSSAIDWKETWIVSLLSFHAVIFLLIILTRKRLGVQSAIFFFISIIVRMSERINSYCAIHWQEFSTQNYFDKNGLFAGVFLAAPLLMMCLLMLVSASQMEPLILSDGNLLFRLLLNESNFNTLMTFLFYSLIFWPKRHLP